MSNPFMPPLKQSPRAAEDLLDAVESGEYDVDDLMGTTDCPEGCEVEPDGYCYHGYLSAGRSAGVI